MINIYEKQVIVYNKLSQLLHFLNYACAIYFQHLISNNFELVIPNGY